MSVLRKAAGKSIDRHLGRMRYFSCSWKSCGKVFTSRADLCRHYRIHTNERPFTCPQRDCSKEFHQKSSLKVHLRTHTGERPYVCIFQNCQKAFADPSTYARHQRTHTNDKPYVCPIPNCGQRFSRQSSLRRHQDVLHGGSSLTKPHSDHESLSMQQPTFDGVPALQASSCTHQAAAAGALTALPEHFLARCVNDAFENSCEEFDASELFRPIHSTGLSYVPSSLARGDDNDQIQVPFTYVQSFHPTKCYTQFS